MPQSRSCGWFFPKAYGHAEGEPEHELRVQRTWSGRSLFEYAHVAFLCTSHFGTTVVVAAFEELHARRPPVLRRAERGQQRGGSYSGDDAARARLEGPLSSPGLRYHAGGEARDQTSRGALVALVVPAALRARYRQTAAPGAGTRGGGGTHRVLTRRCRGVGARTSCLLKQWFCGECNHRCQHDGHGTRSGEFGSVGWQRVHRCHKS